jgi:hypothetical protein
MPPNYRGLLAIIPPAMPQGSHQPVSGPKTHQARATNLRDHQ